jgi:hypothetical protein
MNRRRLFGGFGSVCAAAAMRSAWLQRKRGAQYPPL